MDEKIQEEQAVQNIQHATRGYAKLENHSFWIDKKQAHYIDKELLVDSASWVLRHEKSQSDNSPCINKNINYWLVRADPQNVASSLNENKFQTDGYSVKRLICDTDNDNTKNNIATSKRLRTQISQQNNIVNCEKNMDQPQNLTEADAKDSVPTNSSILNEYMQRRTNQSQQSQIGQEHCFKKYCEWRNPNKTNNLYLKEDNQERSHSSDNVWFKSTYFSTEKKMKTTHLGNTEIFSKSGQSYLVTKFHNHHQDPKTCNIVPGEMNKFMTDRCPDCKGKSPLKFSVRGQEKVTPISEISLCIPWQNNLPNKQTFTDRKSVVDPTLGKINEEESSSPYSLNNLSLKSSICKEGKLCDKTPLSQTIVQSKIETAETSHVSCPDSLIKVIPNDNQLSNATDHKEIRIDNQVSNTTNHTEIRNNNQLSNTTNHSEISPASGPESWLMVIQNDNQLSNTTNHTEIRNDNQLSKTTNHTEIRNDNQLSNTTNHTEIRNDNQLSNTTNHTEISPVSEHESWLKIIRNDSQLSNTTNHTKISPGSGRESWNNVIRNDNQLSSTTNHTEIRNGNQLFNKIHHTEISPVLGRESWINLIRNHNQLPNATNHTAIRNDKQLSNTTTDTEISPVSGHESWLKVIRNDNQLSNKTNHTEIRNDNQLSNTTYHTEVSPVAGRESRINVIRNDDQLSNTKNHSDIRKNNQQSNSTNHTKISPVSGHESWLKIIRNDDQLSNTTNHKEIRNDNQLSNTKNHPEISPVSDKKSWINVIQNDSQLSNTPNHSEIRNDNQLSNRTNHTEISPVSGPESWINVIQNNNQLSNTTNHTEIRNGNQLPNTINHTDIGPVSVTESWTNVIRNDNQLSNAINHTEIRNDNQLSNTTNHTEISPISGPESWIKIIQNNTQLSNKEIQGIVSDQVKAQVTANQKKLDELRQGFRGTYVKMDFSKPNENDPKPLMIGVNQSELSSNAECVVDKKLSRHNEKDENENTDKNCTSAGKEKSNTRRIQSEQQIKENNLFLQVIENKIQSLLRCSVQSRNVRKTLELPKTVRGDSKHDGIFASTSNSMIGSDRVSHYSNDSQTNKKSQQKSLQISADKSKKQEGKPRRHGHQYISKKYLLLKLLTKQAQLKAKVTQKNEVIQSRMQLESVCEKGAQQNESGFTDAIQQDTRIIKRGNKTFSSTKHNPEIHTTEQAWVNPDQGQLKSSFSEKQKTTASAYYQPLRYNNVQCQSLISSLKTEPKKEILNALNKKQETNATDVQLNSKFTISQLTLNKTQNQELSEPLESSLRIFCEKELSDDNYQKLKYIGQCLKTKYDKYIEGKRKLINKNQNAEENSGEKMQKLTRNPNDSDNDVAVIDYFDVDSFIKLEAMD